MSPPEASNRRFGLPAVPADSVIVLAAPPPSWFGLVIFTPPAVTVRLPVKFELLPVRVSTAGMLAVVVPLIVRVLVPLIGPFNVRPAPIEERSMPLLAV